MVANLPPKQRDALIVTRRSQKVSFRAIGEELGISTSRVADIYNRLMRDAPPIEVQTHRAEMLEEIDLVRRTALAVLDGKTPVVSARGEIVFRTGPEGSEELVDPGPQLQAAKLLLEANARLGKLIGADAPEKVQQSGTISVTINGVDPREMI